MFHVKHLDMNKVMSSSLPELLAPAGSPESLKAALAAGADAVYFGGTSFSNRMRARNFVDSELTDAVKTCHSVGAAAHITVNIRLRDREFDSMLRFVDCLASSGEDSVPDALIVADLGVAAEIHKRFPELTLHASTQTSMATISDAEFLKNAGFSRLVIPREMSLEEIRELCRKSPIEIEMFIHGAHCVSYSGQCLLSYVMGGRSGNRGECAGPCRLPFAVREIRSPGDFIGHGEAAANQNKPGLRANMSDSALSLADMCLAERIKDVIASGVSSLKIEGRMKPAPYVYGVTRIYRRLLDERRNARQDEVRALADLFTRGFTDGYYSHNYTAMASKSVGGSTAKNSQDKQQTDNPSDKEVSAEILRGFEARLRENGSGSGDEKIPITAHVKITADEACVTFATVDEKNGGGIAASVHGDPPLPATGTPIDRQYIERYIMKLGDTKYSLSGDSLTVELGENLWYAASAVNKLRREAAAMLDKKIAENEETAAADKKSAGEKVKIQHDFPQYEVQSEMYKSEKTVNTAEIAAGWSLRDIDAGVLDYFDTLYVPPHLFGACTKYQPHTEIAAVLPPMIFDNNALRMTLEILKKEGCGRVLCHMPGEAMEVIRAGMTADISFRANVANSAAAHVYREMGCDRIYVSPELNLTAAGSLAGGAIIYGRLPLMTLGRCAVCGGKCRRGGIGGREMKTDNYASLAKNYSFPCMAELRDRRGESFPVLGENCVDCVNVVYNSRPTWMADRADELNKVRLRHFMFTTEDSREIKEIIRDYKNGARRGNVRRV